MILLVLFYLLHSCLPSCLPAFLFLTTFVSPCDFEKNRPSIGYGNRPLIGYANRSLDWIRQSTFDWIRQSTFWLDTPIDLWLDTPIGNVCQSTNQSMIDRYYVSTNQPINQSIDQPNNQPITPSRNIFLHCGAWFLFSPRNSAPCMSSGPRKRRHHRQGRKRRDPIQHKGGFAKTVLRSVDLQHNTVVVLTNFKNFCLCY